MSQYDNIMQLMGSIAVRQNLERSDTFQNIRDAEFRVFSQFGDDGIIQYLIRACAIVACEQRFVEFGVENYAESNTRFLLINDNWSGLVMDPSEQNIASISNDEISWRHDLQSKCCCITPNNINDIFSSADFARDLGILSIDIDGMDYWVWKSLVCVEPVVVICEYNSVFGSTAKVTVPYKENFHRGLAHHSNLYFGASLAALVDLANTKGYSLIGANSAGNNAYFVRTDRLGNLSAVSAEQGYVESKFRESRDETGRLTYIRSLNRVSLINHMPVYDIESDSVMPLRDAI